MNALSMPAATVCGNTLFRSTNVVERNTFLNTTLLAQGESGEFLAKTLQSTCHIAMRTICIYTVATYCLEVDEDSEAIAYEALSASFTTEIASLFLRALR